MTPTPVCILSEQTGLCDYGKIDKEKEGWRRMMKRRRIWRKKRKRKKRSREGAVGELCYRKSGGEEEVNLKLKT